MHRFFPVILTLSLGAASVALAHDEPLAQRPLVENLAKNVADELARLCPAAQPNDQAAFNTCRQGPLRRLGIQARSRADRVVGTAEPDGRNSEGHQPHPVRSRCAQRHVRLAVHVQRQAHGRFRHQGRFVSRRPRNRVSQSPRAGPVSVSLLARRQQVDHLPGRKLDHALDRSQVDEGESRAVHQQGNDCFRSSRASRSLRRSSTANGNGPMPTASRSRW